jgi:hypothetical protein
MLGMNAKVMKVLRPLTKRDGEIGEYASLLLLEIDSRRGIHYMNEIRSF